jgi:hypothetical protein
MYLAKAAGRNRVRTLMHRTNLDLNVYAGSSATGDE